MPKGIYNIKCKPVEHKEFNPTEHQKATLEYFLTSPYKGLLLYHKLGSGKTCTSIIIADSMLAKNMINHVFILTPGSLRDGWVKEYCENCGEKSSNLSEKFTFITYNYMIGNNLPDFSGSLVIIDEVHNLINGAKNFSKHPTSIYNALLSSNCRILALSGTPIYNYVYEFALLGNLLKPGGDFPEIRVKGELQDGLFMNWFADDNGQLKPKNISELKKRLEGIVSYYPGAGTEFVPEIIEQEPFKITMSYDQEINYWVYDEVEKQMSRKPSEKLKATNPKLYEQLLKLFIMAKKNILTRKASNFYYPKEVEAKKDLLVKNGGWIDSAVTKNGNLRDVYSSKLSAFLMNLAVHINQKHVLFTFFKNKSGVYLIKSILELCGIPAEIFSGDLNDTQRRKLLKEFNSEENRYGNKIKVLLVTEAGAEGISVLEARHMHIFESSPRMSKTIQAIGRVARYRSHIDLPENERNINIWKYWSIASPFPTTVEVSFINFNGDPQKVVKTVKDKTTMDEILYDRGMVTVRQINSFLNVLKSVSVTKWD